MPAEYALGTAWHDRIIPEKIMDSCIVENFIKIQKRNCLKIRPAAVAMIVLAVPAHAEHPEQCRVHRL